MNALGQSLLATLQASGNLRAFLRMIREGESGQTEAAYRTIVGGGQVSDLTDHPRQRVYVEPLNVWSTAAGAYQFLERTWDGCVRALGLADFQPQSQDAAAVYLIRGRQALDDVLAGRVQDAIRKCAREWASIPGSPYGQPVMTMQRALDVYRTWGGTDRPDGAAAPIESREIKKEGAMPIPVPIVTALLPSLIEAIPKLGRLFSSGSKTAERNVAAAEVALEVVQQAVGARNAQEAIEIVQTDTSARALAEQAIDARWYELTEAGGGGIEGARKADAAARKEGDGVWKSPALVISLVLLVMPMMLLVDVFYVHPDNYASEMRTQIVTGVLMVISIVGGFWLGSSFGSARKNDMIAGPRGGV